jgi:hypothetical protein
LLAGTTEDYSAHSRGFIRPETTRLLGLAYERACESVAPDMTIREALAKRIIEAAKRGERDLEGLIKYGLGKNNMLADAV